VNNNQGKVLTVEKDDDPQMVIAYRRCTYTML